MGLYRGSIFLDPPRGLRLAICDMKTSGSKTAQGGIFLASDVPGCVSE